MDYVARLNEKSPSINKGFYIFLKVFNVAMYIFQALTNALGNFSFFGETNAQVSDSYDSPITPAGYAFSIWGLIFFTQAVFVIYQALNVNEPTKMQFVYRINVLVGISWFMQGLWVIVFGYRLIWWSMAIMAIDLLALLAAYVRINTIKFDLFEVFRSSPSRSDVLWSILRYITFYLPISLNFAWINVATCLNIAIGA